MIIQSKWLVLLAIGVFFGFLISVTGIALLPQLGNISKPLVCTAPKILTIQSYHYSYKPGQSGVTRTFYCEDETGKKEAVSFKVFFYSFLIYSLFSSLVVYGIISLKAKRQI